MEERSERILLVDDDENLLAGLLRRLRRRFDVATASDPREALRLIETDGPFAVVVSDMSMPGMDGVTFLSRVGEICGDCIRMMLTGHSDLATAMNAVNHGNVFRFLAKPCPADELATFLDAGLHQHRLQAAAQRAAVLEEASRAKSNFLATVSHELRTPLSVVHSNAEVLAFYAAEESSEVRAKFTDAILAESGRLNELIGRLLLMAELDAGLVEPSASQVDLIEVLEALASAARPNADRKYRIVLDLERSADPAHCSGDRGLIDNAFGQILRNACQFSPEDGEVRISLRRLPELHRVTVADRGPGVAEDVLPEVFEPFAQRDQVLTNKPPGLGLGLAIAKKAFDLIGATICCGAAPGGGAEFTVDVPAKESESRA